MLLRQALQKGVILFCVFLMDTTYSVASEDKPTVYGLLLQDRLNIEGTEQYNDVLHYILQDIRTEINVARVPFRRGVKHFFDSEKACLYPTVSDVLRYGRSEEVQKMSMPQSLPLDTVQVGLYSRRDQPKIKTTQDVKGKVVGHVMGTFVERLVSKMGVIARPVPDSSMLLRMLDRGRIDSYIGYHPDTPISMESLGIDEINHFPDVVLYKTKVHMVCRGFDKAEEFIKKIDTRIRELHESGELQNMLGPYAVIEPLPNK